MSAWRRRQLLKTPFQECVAKLGEIEVESPQGETPEIAQLIGRFLRGANRHVPWRCACLEQALTGLGMLKRRGIPATVYIGVEKKGESFSAHAWLRCGEEILTGAPEHKRYQPIFVVGVRNAK